MKKLITFSLCFCLVFIGGVARAEEPMEEMVFPIGTIKTIPVNSPKRIAIGNPDIADITSAKESELTILGKAQGTTTLIVWDGFGEQKYSLVITPVDMAEVKNRIDSMLETLGLPSVTSKVEDKEGKVFLLGSVKTPQERERLAVALVSLKDKIIDLIEVKEEEAVVEIDVQVLELSKDATRTLGLTWPAAINFIERGSPGIQPAGVKPSTLFKVLNLERATGSGADPFTFKLDALIQEGKAQVLSRPRLACQSGKEAELLVGGEKPIFTTQVATTAGGGDTTSISYKEYGIKLKVKPTVVEGERIKLGLNVEVSEVGIADSIGTTGSSSVTTAKAYPLTKRTVSTELYLNNAQSMAIGGLIKQKSAEDVRRVPGLSNIPILGLFFRQKTSTSGGGTGERGNMELFIILTPTIISQKLDTGLKQGAKEAPAPVYYTVDENLSTPLGKYASVVKKRILDNLTYPSLAKEAGFQGEVNLRLLLSYKGELLQAKIKRSSGYSVLDENTLKVAKEITPYPPLPESIKEKEIWVDIPIVYRLD